MKYIILTLFLGVFKTIGFSQERVIPLPKKVKGEDFSYSLFYNTATQCYDAHFYPLPNNTKTVYILQIWTGKEYRDFSSECQQYFSEAAPGELFLKIVKKHPQNLIGNPPKYKGNILIIYNVNGKKKQKILNNPQLYHQPPVYPAHKRTPPDPPCSYF